MRTGLRLAAVLATAIAISFTSPGQITGVAIAVPCPRTVGIEPQVSIGEGGGALTFHVFTNGCPQPGEVSFGTTAGSAGGDDFKSWSGKLTWVLGEVGVKTITVPVTQDLLLEPGLEDLVVRLANPTLTLQIVNAVSQGRILDDDGPGVLWAPDDSACVGLMPNPKCLCQNVFQLMPYEPNCGRPTLHLSSSLPRPTTVHWMTWGGDAIPGVDYEPVPAGVTTVTAFQTSTELHVRLLSNPGAPRRHFFVKVTGVSHGTVVDNLAMITIQST